VLKVTLNMMLTCDTGGFGGGGGGRTGGREDGRGRGGYQVRGSQGLWLCMLRHILCHSALTHAQVDTISRLLLPTFIQNNAVRRDCSCVGALPQNLLAPGLAHAGLQQSGWILPGWSAAAA
jgi:hypothetical protein